MTNFYIDSKFPKEYLEGKIKSINENLSEVGALYDGTANYDNLSDIQKESMANNSQGYEYGEQIHDMYSEIGAILQAIDALQ